MGVYTCIEDSVKGESGQTTTQVDSAVLRDDGPRAPGQSGGRQEGIQSQILDLTLTRCWRKKAKARMNWDLKNKATVLGWWVMLADDRTNGFSPWMKFLFAPLIWCPTKNILVFCPFINKFSIFNWTPDAQRAHLLLKVCTLSLP